MRSDELFCAIWESGISIKDNWWPDFGTFSVVISAILVQRTKWENVENSLINLKNAKLFELENLANCDVQNLASLIKPSGFFNQKAVRLKNLCTAIVREFGEFGEFKRKVGREWLYLQKGIGLETCDAILCYACERENMVVDNYTTKILSYLNFEFESYDEAKSWLENIDSDKICKFLGQNLTQNQIYAKFHGLIVEFCKIHLKGQNFSQKAQEILDALK